MCPSTIDYNTYCICEQASFEIRVVSEGGCACCIAYFVNSVNSLDSVIRLSKIERPPPHCLLLCPTHLSMVTSQPIHTSHILASLIPLRVSHTPLRTAHSRQPDAAEPPTRVKNALATLPAHTDRQDGKPQSKGSRQPVRHCWAASQLQTIL